jgi:hypothetical protein
MIEKSIASALEPIVDTLVELEKKVESFELKHGVDGKDGRDGKDADPIDPQVIVKEVLALVPVPKDGLAGKDGVDGKDGRDGKDAIPVNEDDLIAKVLPLIPTPKDADPAVVAEVLKTDPDFIAKATGPSGPAGPVGPAGADAPPVEIDIDEVAKTIIADKEFITLTKGKDGETGAPGQQGEPGITTVEVIAKHDATPWIAGIHRQDSIVQHFLGRLYVAKCDTTEEPGDSDHWQRLGLSGMRFTGGHKKDHDYEVGDIYVKDYSAFMWDGEKAHLIAARQKETPAIEVAKSLIAQPKFLEQVIGGLAPDLKQAVDVVVSEEITKTIDRRFEWMQTEGDEWVLFDHQKSMVVTHIEHDAVKALIAAADAKDKLPPLTRFVGNHETGRSYVRGDVINFGNQLYVCWKDGTIRDGQDIAEHLVVMLASSVIGGGGGGGGGTLWPANPFPVGVASNDFQQGNIWLDGSGLIRYVDDNAAKTALVNTNTLQHGTLIFQRDTEQIFQWHHPVGQLNGQIIERLPGHPKGIVLGTAQASILQTLSYDPTKPVGDRIEWEDDRTRLEVVDLTVDLNDRAKLPISHLAPGKIVFVRTTGTLWEFTGNPAAMTNDFRDWKPLVTRIPTVARFGLLPAQGDPHLLDGVVYAVKDDFGGQDLNRLFMWDGTVGGSPATTGGTVTPPATPGFGTIADVAGLRALPRPSAGTAGVWGIISPNINVPVGAGTPFDGQTLTDGSTIMSLGDPRYGTQGWAIVPGLTQPSTTTLNPGIKLADISGFVAFQTFWTGAQNGEWAVVTASNFTVHWAGNPLDGIFLPNGTTILINDLTDPNNGFQVTFPTIAGGTTSVPNTGNPNPAHFGASGTYAGQTDFFLNNPLAVGAYHLMATTGTYPPDAGALAGQPINQGDFVYFDGTDYAIMSPADVVAMQAAYPNPFNIGGTPVAPPQPPDPWIIPGPNVVVPAAQPPVPVPVPPLTAVTPGEWIPIEPHVWIKRLRTDPNQPTDQQHGDFQVTTENLHKELKVYDANSRAWIDVFTEDAIKGWIAALSLFEGTVQEVGGTAIGAIELSAMPDLVAMSAANDLTMTSHYWTWMGSPGYQIKVNDPNIGVDLNGGVLNPGDWLQIANLGGDGSGVGANGGAPDLHWVTVGGDLLAKSRADLLYGLQAWTAGGWEQGALVVYQGDVYRASRGIVASDPAPGLGKLVSIVYGGTPDVTVATPAGMPALDATHPTGYSVALGTAITFGATGPFANRSANIGDTFFYLGDPTLTGTTADGREVDGGWVWMPSGMVPTTNFDVQMKGGAWTPVEISGGLKVVTDDQALPPVAPAGQVHLVLMSSQAGGKQALFSFDPAANQWVQLGGGGQPIDFSLRKQVVSLGVPVGTVITFAGRFVPPGYLLCDGSVFDQLIYPELFVTLGNSNRVPNLTDQFIRGSMAADFGLPAKSFNKGRNLGNNLDFGGTEVFFRRRDLQVGDHIFFVGTPPVMPRGSNLPAGIRIPSNSNIMYCGEGYGFELFPATQQTVIVKRDFPFYRDSTNQPRMRPFTTTSNGDHNHAQTAVPSRGSGSTTWAAANANGQTSLTGTAGAHTHTITGGDVETMPAHIVMAFLIKADDRTIRTR